MNYEQKYKEALEKARQLYAYPTTKPFISDLQDIFPELKESEDEKMRKSIIYALRNGGFYNNDKTDEAIAWLKKQYKKDSQVILPQFTFDDILALQCCMETVKKVQEDKDLYEKLKDLHGRVYDAYQIEKQNDNADKVEPKFKEGQWIVFNGLTLYINEVVKGYYRTISKGGIANSYDWDIDNIARLWTIKEAKNDDVLVASDGSIFIYKNQRDNGAVHYIAVTPYNDLVINENDYSWDNKNVCHPATKDEQTILFERMKEAGYVWDADKKELKKL